jgi:MFS superfamily sulfate permease-like transporter
MAFGAMTTLFCTLMTMLLTAVVIAWFVSVIVIVNAIIFLRNKDAADLEAKDILSEKEKP